MFYPTTVKPGRPKKLTTEDVNICPHLISTAHGYVRHAGAEWPSEYSILNQIYLILRAVLLKDAIAFACDNRIEIAARDDQHVGESDDSVVVPGADSSTSEDIRHEQANASIGDDIMNISSI